MIALQQTNDARSSATMPTPLDPNYLLDIENDARHLATSVDSLVENLASILHNISALTVDAIEVYRLVGFGQTPSSNGFPTTYSKLRGFS